MHFPFSSPTGDRKRNHSLSFAPPQTQPQISHVHVKLEVGAAAAFSPLAPAMNAPNDDRQPKTATEMHLLSQLRDMGFTSSTEVLESIRRLTSESAQPPSIDTVMIDIISQREEAEEAKKMDEARLQSEQARKEDARRRREVIEKTLQESIKSASLDDWRRNANMFLDSWLLAGDACYLLEPLMNTSATIKEKLVALLKLEKKARKWYGAVLPRGYFAERVTKRLQEESTVGAVSELLQEEVDTLEVAMFTLSEQKGGVPRIFLEAHDEASALDSSLQTGESGEDIDDDVVVVVLANKANSTRLSEKSTPEAAPEILEIL
jgi:DNA-directed RNA polymerase beta subunit